MDNELITALEGRIEALLAGYASLKKDNIRLSEENDRLRSDHDAVRSRVDGLLKKLENI